MCQHSSGVHLFSLADPCRTFILRLADTLPVFLSEEKLFESSRPFGTDFLWLLTLLPFIWASDTCISPSSVLLTGTWQRAQIVVSLQWSRQCPSVTCPVSVQNVTTWEGRGALIKKRVEERGRDKNRKKISLENVARTIEVKSQGPCSVWSHKKVQADS